MTSTELHHVPRTSQVIREQLNAVALSLRLPAIGVAALATLVTMLALADFLRGRGGVEFAPELSLIPAFAGALLPIAVWQSEQRFGPGFLWTLPVDRTRHALAKVFAGWLLLTLHASPINISYQEAFAGLNPDADPRKVDLAFAVVAHEIGHQWWGNQLSPADIEGGPLLSESLAWYSAMCIVAASLGEDHLQRLLDMMHEGSWTISSRASVPLMRVYSRFAAYRKGPFAMYALREYVGEDPVKSALRRLFDKYKSGEPPLPTTKDLYAELKSVTPDSLQSLLADLFERNTYWELKTKRVSAEPAGQGKWRVAIDVTARKVVVDTKGAETEVQMDDPVEIGVYGSGGNATRGAPLYRGMHRIKAGAQRISVLVAAQPVRAGIDPRNLLIDADPTDNLKGVSGPP